jgi:sulfate permease, SulP family
MFGEFIPKSYSCLRSGYNRLTFKKDLAAGITVGIVALPLAMALGIASGVSPERGLITAIVAGFLTSALGGSRILIGGPAGAFVVLIYNIMQRTGYTGLVMATLLASVLLILIGVFRLGSWIKYIPHPLVVGLTTGIGIGLFSSQLKDLFGLQVAHLPPNFIGKIQCYTSSFSSYDLATTLLGLGTLAFIICIRHFAPRIPWGIVAMLLASLCYYVFNLPVETIHSKFGDLSCCIPAFSIPSFAGYEGTVGEVFLDAMAIAFLGGIQSLLSSVIGDGMTGGRHKSNVELIGQGVANFGSVLFGGIPSTGSVARTVANVKAGAKTPVSGMIHSLTLLVIALFFSPVVSYIPLTALSAILIMVAWNMSEVGYFINLLKAPKADVAILVTAFMDIIAAIILGMVLSCFLFMKKMSELSKTVTLKKIFEDDEKEAVGKHDPDSIANKEIPGDVEVYEVQGPFFFGSADILQDLLVDLSPKPRVFILRLRHAAFIDTSGMHALKEFYERCEDAGIVLLLSGVHGQIKKDLKKSGLTKLIGKSRISSDIDASLKKAATYP